MSKSVKIEVKKIATLNGHKDCVYNLSYGITENKILSCAGDGMVVEWDLETPENGVLLSKLNNSVYALARSEKEQTLLAGDNFDGIHKINLHTQKEERSLKITDKAIFTIAYFGDNILIGDAAGNLYVVDAEIKFIKRTLQVSTSSIRSIAVLNETIAIGTSDNNIYILNKNYQVVNTLTAHSNSVFVVKFSPDGKFLLSAGRDAHLKIWNVEKNFELQEDIVAHMFTINDLAYSPDGNYFVTCSMDKSVKVWDANSFKLLKVIDKARHAGHGTSINRVLWSNYRNYLLSASDDRTISVWELTFEEALL